MLPSCFQGRAPRRPDALSPKVFAWKSLSYQRRSRRWPTTRKSVAGNATGKHTTATVLLLVASRALRLLSNLLRTKGNVFDNEGNLPRDSEPTSCLSC